MKKSMMYATRVAQAEKMKKKKGRSGSRNGSGRGETGMGKGRAAERAGNVSATLPHTVGHREL